MAPPDPPNLPPPLYTLTPLIPSPALSARLRARVFLKLESLQPSQSFKHRGISLFAQTALSTHGKGVHLVAASGGNAGLAVAVCAREMGVRCTVFVPAAAGGVRAVLEREGAEVVVGGEAYVDALREAEALVASSPDAVLVPAYDNPLLWRGHSTLIHEIASQLPPLLSSSSSSSPDSSSAGPKVPSAILCSVGGGGLIGGVLTGVRDLGWHDTTVVGLETVGSECFHLSMLQNPSFCTPEERPELGEGVKVWEDEDEREGGRVRLVTLPRITSRAASLGASSPAAGVVRLALERGRLKEGKGGVRCVSVRDEMSMAAGLLFLEEHKMLTELACSTTLVPAYSKPLFDHILPPVPGEDPTERIIIFIVCGGVKISLKEVEEYERVVREDREGSWAVVDGRRWVHPEGL